MDMQAVTAALDERGIPYATKGRKLMARCWMHDDHDPSLSINKHTGFYECYGCGEKGSYRELCEELDIPYDGDEAKPLRPKRVKLPEPRRRTVRIIPDLLDGYEPHERAYRYMKQRGITKTTAALYDVRYQKSPSRIIIPICTGAGEVVSLYERDIKGSMKLKTADTDNKLVLFGLHVLRKLGLDMSPLLVVEGEIDCMSVVQAGYPCVSTMGLSITDAQYDLMARYRIHYLVDHDIYERREYYRTANRIKSELRKRSGSVTVGYVNYKQCKDCNDILKYHGTAALRKYIEGVLK